uniref:Uncharacterized protein n=1 Tax=Ciona intestinalis TaxID=7719 RepID=H2XVB0_CIOIN
MLNLDSMYDKPLLRFTEHNFSHFVVVFLPTP